MATSVLLTQLLAAACLPVAGHAAVATTEPTRIMLAGDSITQGRSGDFTYRYWLWRGLQSVGADVDLVGPRRDLAYGTLHYLDPRFDLDHAAVAGATTTSSLPRVADEVATYAPDVIVLMIGFNDLRVRTAEATADNLRRTIETARTVDPDVDIVLGQVTTQRVPDTGELVKAAETLDLNNRISTLASELDTVTSSITVASTALGWTPATFTWDGIHPTPSGQTHLAQAFADALVANGTLTTRPSIKATVAWPATFAPTGLGGNRSITLRWDTTRIDAWSARVRYRLLSKPGSPAVTTGFKPGSTRVITGLAAGGLYEIQVQPRRGTMQGAWSKPIRVRASGQRPRAVTGLRAAWSRTRVRVTWRQEVAAFTHDIVFRTRRPGRAWGAWKRTTAAGGTRTLPVSSAARRVRVRVAARNAYLTGPAATLVSRRR
ncbi:GDSL-type esterase/lipase family protein [Mumia sp. DW29H23]|uniref:GDSL-type esterase/lipase family protein n=1 Tax=Mumia sp. DW29H23 TaxID=3421241 RepID=UPI003D699A5C